MAEFDPLNPPDATEAAYRDAMLGDEAGREQRRARLMAALPRPEPAAVPVSQGQLAWRWQPYAWGVLATGLLVAAVLALRRPSSEVPPHADPRLAAPKAASAAIVVAQAEQARESVPVHAPAVVASPPPPPRAAAKASLQKLPSVTEPAPAVVADAKSERAVVVASAIEAGRSAVEEARPTPPPMAVAPAAPAALAAPLPAPVMAPPPAAPAMAPKVMAEQRVEVPARAGAAVDSVADRSRMAAQSAGNLAAPETASPLLAAVNQSDAVATRAALQAGASPHLRDPQGRTALMLAARTGSREVVDLLLGAGARKADRDPQGWTAADHAQAQGHRELAERLR